jgi:hypothetical protein
MKVTGSLVCKRFPAAARNDSADDFQSYFLQNTPPAVSIAFYKTFKSLSKKPGAVDTGRF